MDGCRELDALLLQHAHVHSAAVVRTEATPLEDVLLGGLTEEQLRLRPGPDLNSLAWLVWHMARTEDIAVNAVMAGLQQVFEEGEWAGRLGVRRSDVGTGMTDVEVEDVTRAIKLTALGAYRAEVGRRTQKVISGLTPADLDQRIDEADVDRVFARGAIGANAGWMRGLWTGKTKRWFLWLATGHNYMHIGEGITLRRLNGFPLPF